LAWDYYLAGRQQIVMLQHGYDIKAASVWKEYSRKHHGFVVKEPNRHSSVPSSLKNYSLL
jgi:NAD(P)H-dependent FMN reductase